MAIAIYSGSFDPITNGHLEILKNASKIFDKVIITVAYNINKKTLLTVDERINLLKKSVANIKNVEVDFYEGLTVDYAKRVGATILLRGIRSALDFEYEMQMAQINEKLNNELKTIFIPANNEYGFISSSMVKEIFFNKGNISEFVPKEVFEYLNTKYDI